MEGNKEKYPLAVEWNQFVGYLLKARLAWEELQGKLDEVSGREMEEKYPVAAQRYLTKFRKVKFEWMLPMLVDFARGKGGLEMMRIILPVEKRPEKGKEKS